MSSESQDLSRPTATEQTGEMKTAETQPVATAGGESDFARQAAGKPPGLLAEFVDFLLHNKKWWLTPIILVLLLLGLLVWFGGSAAAPFIYTLGCVGA